MSTEEELEQFWAWRDAERKKHRVMTMAEHAAWCRGGDAISHPSQASAFPGGITILFGDGKPLVLGYTTNAPPDLQKPKAD